MKIHGYDGYELTKNFEIIGKKGKPLTLCNAGNYKYVNVMKDGKQAILYLHRAIALVFNIDTYFDGAVVDHIDNNPFNNSPDNLQWCTYAHNLSKDKNNNNIEKQIQDLEKKLKKLNTRLTTLKKIRNGKKLFTREIYIKKS